MSRTLVYDSSHRLQKSKAPASMADAEADRRLAKYLDGINIDEQRDRHICPADRQHPLRRVLKRLVHSHLCHSPRCKSRSCHRGKRLFNHVIRCKTGEGYCHLCDKSWRLLRLHTRPCKQSNCNVRDCKSLAESISKIRKRLEDRRSFRQRRADRRMLQQQQERLGRLQLQQPDSQRGAAAGDAGSGCS